MKRFAFAVLLLSVPLITFAFEPVEGIVESAALNVRIKPGAKRVDPVLAVLKKNDKVKILKEEKGWFEIEIPFSAEVWIFGELLKGNEVVKEARLRSGPGVQHAPYQMNMKPGAKLEIIRKSADGWVKVKPPQGLTAWISSEFVKIPKKDAKTAVAGNAKQAITPPQPPANPADKTAGQIPEKKTIAPDNTTDKSAKAKDAPPQDKEKTLEGAKPVITDAKTVDKPDKPDKPDNKETAEKTNPPDAGKEKKEVQKPLEVTEKPKDNEIEEKSEKKEKPVLSPDAQYWNGIIAGASGSGVKEVTHALVKRGTDGKASIPQCYLKSKKIDLSKFENSTVRLSGSEKSIPGWKCPLVDVETIETIK